jgi:hypothetical protein
LGAPWRTVQYNDLDRTENEIWEYHGNAQRAAVPKSFPGKGARFGAHAATEAIYPPSYGKIISVSWFNAGVRIWDIRDPKNPKPIAYYIQAPNQKTIASCSTINGVTKCFNATMTDYVEYDDRGYIHAADRAGYRHHHFVAHRRGARRHAASLGTIGGIMKTKLTMMAAALSLSAAAFAHDVPQLNAATIAKIKPGATTKARCNPLGSPWRIAQFNDCGHAPPGQADEKWDYRGTEANGSYRLHMEFDDRGVARLIAKIPDHVPGGRRNGGNGRAG